MNIREAVSLARAGEERGFGYLYENTYKSKYYLALSYMKNEEQAKDVLQEAYIKAFNNLDKLDNPDVFVSWLGTIVANTAKNALSKKNPMLFTDIVADETEENFEYQIEDENTDNQPEVAYTRKETQELVHELLDSLSPEQRICMLMFHIEGASIKEIAEALDCSDNTVKSRLNYGRKNLKTKAEELQKKGYKLYSIAPVQLLLLLLHSDKAALIADGSLAKAGESMVNGIFEKIPLKYVNSHANIDLNKKAATQKNRLVKNTGAVKKAGFLYASTGKITAIVVGACVAGSAAFYGASQMKQDTDSLVKQTVPIQEESDNLVENTQTESKETINEKTSENSSESSKDTRIKEIYKGVLQSVKNQEEGFDFPNAVDSTEEYMYLVYDMDGNGIPELIVGKSTLVDKVFEGYDCRIYSIDDTKEDYELKEISGESVATGFYIPTDGNGLYTIIPYRMSGTESFYRYTINSDEYAVNIQEEQEVVMGGEELKQFNIENTYIEWHNITDLSEINNIK